MHQKFHFGRQGEKIEISALQAPLWSRYKIVQTTAKFLEALPLTITLAKILGIAFLNVESSPHWLTDRSSMQRHMRFAHHQSRISRSLRSLGCPVHDQGSSHELQDVQDCNGRVQVLADVTSTSWSLWNFHLQASLALRKDPPFSLLILQFFPEKSIFTLLWILPLPQLTCQSRGQISSSMRRWGWLVLQRKDWQSKKAQNRICFTAGRTCYVWFIKGPSGMQGSPCKVVFPQTVQTLNGILLDLCCPITWLALPFLGLETSKNLELEQLKAPPLRSDKLVAVIVILSVFISIGRSVFSLVVSQDLVGIHEWRCSSPGFAFKAWWSPPITTMYFTTTIF